MRKNALILLAGLCAASLFGAPLKESQEPVLFKDVKIDDSFWSPRIEANRTGTIPANEKMCRESGRLSAFKPEYKGPRHIFWDSDVAKWLEAGFYSLQTTPDPELEKNLEAVVDDIVAMQDEDGYLNSFFHFQEPKNRWTYLRHNHELYCAGHLMEAATAHYYATGRRNFLDAMCRYADYICKVFGTGEGQIPGYPGHEEIELALVKLYKCTGEKRYLNQALYFLDQRGKEPLYFGLEEERRGGSRDLDEHGRFYHQIHKPVREQDEARGHAVRALYLYSGMADVARETGDKELLKACKKLFDSIAEKKMYITGGAGPQLGNEGFEGDYVLPTSHICSETCAAIANVFFCHRMLSLTGESKYADVMERVIYNNGLSGVSLDGKAFFYNNQLYTFDPEPGKDRFKPREGHEHPALHRRTWFDCSCCPPNQARFVASIGGYIYATRDREAFINLYIGSETAIAPNGVKTIVSQKTGYPWDGLVSIQIQPETRAEFVLNLRIPGWCKTYDLRLNGQSLKHETEKGYARIERTWNPGDIVTLEMDMPVERVYANQNAKELKGRVALQRGPAVYCLESCDNETNNLDLLSLPREAEITAAFEPGLLGGVVCLKGVMLMDTEAEENAPLYSTKPPYKPVQFKAVPYCVWDNRDPGSVIVWLREK